MMDWIVDPMTTVPPSWLITVAVLVSGGIWGISKQPGIRKLAAIAFGGAVALGLMNLLNTVFAGGVSEIR